MQLTGLSRSTIYLYIKLGKFPAPLKIGERAVAWINVEIEDWLNEKADARITRRDENCGVTPGRVL